MVEPKCSGISSFDGYEEELEAAAVAAAAAAAAVAAAAAAAAAAAKGDLYKLCSDISKVSRLNSTAKIIHSMKYLQQA